MTQNCLRFGRRVRDKRPRRLRVLMRRDLPEHFATKRQDERETIVALHTPNRNADQVAMLIEHTAAGYPRMAISQAGDEAVRRPLADVSGRENDALRIVVAQAEDRIRELVAEFGVDVERRQVELSRLDDGPVAAVHFGV